MHCTHNTELNFANEKWGYDCIIAEEPSQGWTISHKSPFSIVYLDIMNHNTWYIFHSKTAAEANTINDRGGSWSHYGKQVPADTTKQCPKLGTSRSGDAFSSSDTECLDPITTTTTTTTTNTTTTTSTTTTTTTTVILIFLSKK